MSSSLPSGPLCSHKWEPTNTLFLQSTPLSPGILTLPVQFWFAALCRDGGTVTGNIRSLSGTQVCWGKVLNLVITLVIVLLCFLRKGSCVQPPRRVFVERSADRDVGISCQKDHIKTTSYVSMKKANADPDIFEGTLMKIKQCKWFLVVKIWQWDTSTLLRLVRQIICISSMCACVCLLAATYACMCWFVCADRAGGRARGRRRQF